MHFGRLTVISGGGRVRGAAIPHARISSSPIELDSSLLEDAQTSGLRIEASLDRAYHSESLSSRRSPFYCKHMYLSTNTWDPFSD